MTTIKISRHNAGNRVLVATGTTALTPEEIHSIGRDDIDELNDVAEWDSDWCQPGETGDLVFDVTA